MLIPFIPVSMIPVGRFPWIVASEGTTKSRSEAKRKLWKTNAANLREDLDDPNPGYLVFSSSPGRSATDQHNCALGVTIWPKPFLLPCVFLRTYCYPVLKDEDRPATILHWVCRQP